MTGKERIAGAFSRLREQGEKGLIAFTTAGYPDVGSSFEILKALADSGSDLIEIGVPFSDPIADGPVIQKASQAALAGGVRQADIFDIALKLRMQTDIPVLLMTYYNPVLRSGVGNFARRARDSGIDGLIVPDLPVEEDDQLRGEASAAGLSLIPFAAPTSTDRRLARVAARADGFIYCVSVAGVTGARTEIKTDIKFFTDRIRKHTGCPLAVGFGVSGPELAVKIAAHCDAIVVGSAIIRSIEGDGGLSGIIGRVSKLAGDIKEALKS
jgi:tryptophan synthase alpha chain